ncbi:MAG: cytidine deaminase [Bacillota bacterium]|nr:cytidine deaminase [Bacillota bacterium]
MVSERVYDREALIAAAARARESAYAPYSKFKVGAALLTGGGGVFTGCNVENASSGATICAERTAVVKAVSEGERDFVALAVVTDVPRPASPCGICRQVLVEFNPALPVIMANLAGEYRVERADTLLPLAFTQEAMDRP